MCHHGSGWWDLYRFGCSFRRRARYNGSGMRVGTFSGTVVDCRTRFQIKKPTTAFVTHFDANWILTVAIEASDGVPFEPGAERSFAIHSPVQLLFDSAEDCVGKRYGFSVEIDEATARPRWISLSARAT